MRRYTKSITLASGLLALAMATAAGAQDFQVKGASSTILQSQNTDTSTADKVAVMGLSTPQPYWGVGGHFEGGFIGLRSYAYVTGAGSRYGGYFYAANGDNNYGIYSIASGASSYAGYFAGNVYVSGTLTQASDARLKRDIADLPSALSQLLALRPRTYRYRLSDYPALNLADGKQLGLVAQEVAPVFPEIVHEVAVPAEKGKGPGEKILTVDYMKLIPVLIKAVQEQQAEIEALKAEVQLQKR